MSTPRFRTGSSIAKKLLNGLTGLALIAFILMHLAGNLTLLVGQDAFNAYAEALHRLGSLVYVAEIGLLVLFGAHAVSGIRVWLDKRSARSIPYKMAASKGAPSRQTVASRTMILTGIVLLVFVVVHVIQFRFGTWYETTLHGEPVRDLYRLVFEAFQNPAWVAAYTAVMLLLGFHLRHGVWSAFQSVGLLGPGSRPLAFSLAAVVAVMLAVGFLLLPLWMWRFAPAPAAALGFVLVMP